MRLPSQYFTLLLSAATIAGCSAHTPDLHPLRAAEDKLGTGSELNWSFHRLVEDPEGFGLRFPGFLIGMEKTDREILGVPDQELRLNPQALEGADRGVDEKLESYLSHGKRTFISHITETRIAGHGMATCFHFNLYEPDGLGGKKCHGASPPNSSLSLYEQSWQSIDILGSRLEALFAEPDSAPTHVLLFSMGWNTPQQEAIRNYNSLISQLRGAAYEQGQRFQPIFVGLTWPSGWDFPVIPMISYFNKARDADEIGFVWANWLLHHVLGPLGKRHAIPVVLVGHSFGGRLLSRAVFSGAGLCPKPPDGAAATLFIGLQAAFSMNRFILEKKWGMEGAPYAHHHEHPTRVVLTWSSYDRTNPIANWTSGANHAGGEPGYERATEYPDDFDYRRKWDGDGIADLADIEIGKALVIDASDVIRYSTYRKSGHSAIYNEEVARGLWQLIRKFSEAEKPTEAGGHVE